MPIIGVPNPDDVDPDGVRRFADRMTTRIPHVFDDPNEFWKHHGVHSQPSFVFVSADGSGERHTGTLGRDRLLDRALALAQA